MPLGTPAQRADESKDVVLAAMQDELNRSMEKLQLEDLEKPYFVAYTVWDVVRFDIHANFGALVKSERSHARTLKTDVRVGGYDFDNSEFMGMRSMTDASAISTLVPTQLVLDDDYSALRRDIWLTTDAEYKHALQQLAEKRAFTSSQVTVDTIPDFSREAPTKAVKVVRTPEFDSSKWEEKVKRYSEVFREYPLVQASSVRFLAKMTKKYYVNSEGSVVRQPAVLYSLYGTVETQASDGMVLKDYVAFHAESPGELPSEKEITEALRAMAKNVSDITSAPVLEKYVGPVLLTAEAAGDLFAQGIAPHLSGHREPLTDMPQLGLFYRGSDLAGRMGRPVLPSFLTVVDDPAREKYQGTPLVGHYEVDDQAVPAQKVTLINAGTLEAMLMSRRPSKEISSSNGHCRMSAQGTPTAQIGNLFVESATHKSFAELKGELVDRCREEGLEYGLLIRKMDDPVITGRDGPDMIMSMLMGNKEEDEVERPLLVYRVFVDTGREELIRGLEFSEFTLRTFRDIISAADDYRVTNLVVNEKKGGIFGAAAAIGGSAPGGESGIPCSVIAPSILFGELELKKAEDFLRKPTLLNHPFFAK